MSYSEQITGGSINKSRGPLHVPKGPDASEVCHAVSQLAVSLGWLQNESTGKSPRHENETNRKPRGNQMDGGFMRGPTGVANPAFLLRQVCRPLRALAFSALGPRGGGGDFRFGRLCRWTKSWGFVLIHFAWWILSTV